MSEPNKLNQLERENIQFYSKNAEQFNNITHTTSRERYISENEPRLKGDLDLMIRMQQLIHPGAKGLDAGCGPGARDVKFYHDRNYDIYGVDMVEESITLAKQKYPELKDRLSVANLSKPIDYRDHTFDFILCNCVIQHIDPEETYQVTFREFDRLLKERGIIQLMFKTGKGLKKIYDSEYGDERTFQLYEANEVVDYFEELGYHVIPGTEKAIGGVMHFTDVKPMSHCVFYLRKMK